MKFNSRGITKIKIPAIRATMAGTCAAVRVIEVSGGLINRIENGQLSRWQGSGIADACPRRGFLYRNNSPEMSRMRPRFFGTTARAMHWIAICAGLPALYVMWELTMRNRILAIALGGAMLAPIAAQAQSTVTTGVVRDGTVFIND